MSSPNADAIKTPRDLARLIEHTLLAPGATGADLERLCREARTNRFAAVCVHRQMAAEARRLLHGSDVRIVAVVDFPKGEATIGARVIEALEAVRAGVDELDIVAPLPALVAGRWEAVHDDLRAVVRCRGSLWIVGDHGTVLRHRAEAKPVDECARAQITPRAP